MQSNKESYDINFNLQIPKLDMGRTTRWWLPTIGSTFFTLLILAGLLFAQNLGVLSLFAAPNAQTASTGTIAYQGRLADAGGNALTDTVNMSFRLYSAASGGASLWEEQWTGTTSLQVSDGLFNVMLGSVSPIPQDVITGNSNLFLGITVGTDGEMSPRVQLGSVPFATQALTVPDGSITVEKLSAEIAIPAIQSGRVARSVNNSGWTLNEGSGARTFTVPITFAQPFGTSPKVVVSLAHTDINPDTNNRIEVMAQNVTPNGFDLVFRTWHTTRVVGATASWIAHTSP